MDVNLDGNTITNGYFSGVGEDLIQLDADNITSGTLDDARLSALVALLNVANTWTAPQALAALANLTTNGFIKTTSGDGTLVVDPSSYLTGPITLTGDATGSGDSSIATTVTGIGGVPLGPLGTGLLKSAAGTPSIATAGDVASTLSGGSGTMDLSSYTLDLAFSGQIPDNAANTSGNAAGFTGSLAGDVTGTQEDTLVTGINGVLLSDLGAGLLYNSEIGIPSIATANEVATGLTGTTGAVDLSDGTVTLPAASVEISNIDATGTPGSTTYLRGDGTWSTPSGGGGGGLPIVDSFGNAILDVTGGTVILSDDSINGIVGISFVTEGGTSMTLNGGNLSLGTYTTISGNGVSTALGLIYDSLIVGASGWTGVSGCVLSLGNGSSSAGLAGLDATLLTAQRHFKFPDAAGTFALVGDPLTEFSLTGFTLPATNGGTGATTASAGFNLLARALLTTLGDMLYAQGGASPVARLAGNTSAMLAVLTQTGTGSVSAAPAWSTAPSLVITGVTTNSSAAAGKVGEIISSAVASGSAVSLTTATPANVTSISLTAGDWDVEGNVNFADASATVTGTIAGISTTSATLPTDGTEVYTGLQLVTATATDSATLPRKRISVASTTTVYLVGQQTFSAGTAAEFGSITARRVR